MPRRDRPADPPFRVVHLTGAPASQTLAAALRGLADDASWGDAKKLIAGRRVQVNGNLCLDPARRVTPRDVLKVWREALPKPIAADDLRLVYVDRHLLVVEKPAGVTSVRHFEERRLSEHRRQLQPTLEELLPAALARYEGLDRQESLRREPGGPSRKGRGPDRVHPRHNVHRARPGGPSARGLPSVIPVHRLDRDTSGLMLFARSRAAAESLGAMFRKHTIEREYLAVVNGRVIGQTFRSHFVRDRGDGHRGSCVGEPPEDAQLAITHVRPIESLGDFTIVACRLETGRTHQIRIHLAEAGHMLCGEGTYRQTADGRRLLDPSGAPRQALHSASLQLAHPITGQSLKFTSPWPRDIARWLDPLRARTRPTPRTPPSGQSHE
jgi:23S rRNA pseudouridine1911/1915/1917 synthase